MSLTKYMLIRSSIFTVFREHSLELEDAFGRVQFGAVHPARMSCPTIL